MNRPTLPRSILSNSTIVPALDADLIVVVMIDRKTGHRWIAERDEDRCNFKNTAQDIASGQIEPDQVLHVFELGSKLPITEDIARMVLTIVMDEHLTSEREIPGYVRDFLECHLDFRTIAETEKEYAA